MVIFSDFCDAPTCLADVPPWDEEILFVQSLNSKSNNFCGLANQKCRNSWDIQNPTQIPLGYNIIGSVQGNVRQHHILAIWFQQPWVSCVPSISPLVVSLDIVMPCRRQRHITKHAAFGGRVCEGTRCCPAPTHPRNRRDHSSRIVGTKWDAHQCFARVEASQPNLAWWNLQFW